MSVQTELTRISTAKTNIKNVVNNNTANIITNQKLDAFPPLINGTIAAQKGYIPWIKGEGNNFTLKNSKSGELDEFEIYGNTKQDNYTGINLLPKQGFSTPSNDTSYWDRQYDTLTPLENGWGRVIVNDSSSSQRWFNLFIKKGNIDLEPNTQYTFVVEIKNISGFTAYKLSQNNAGEAWSGDINANITVTTQQKFLNQTKSDFSNVTYDLRTFLTLPANKTGAIDIRMMILKGNYTNVDIDYEPYVGGAASPNPDYPQEIKVVEGNNIIKNVGKNQYGITSVESHNYSSGLPASQNNYMIIDSYDLNNIQFHATTNNYLIALLPTYQLKPNTNYIITYKRTNNLISGSYARRYIYSVDDNNNYSLINVLNGGDNGDMSYQFTTGGTGKVAIAFGFNNNSNGSSSTVNNLMVRLATEDDTYQPYQEQTYPIALHGKNLFDGEYEIGGYNVNTGIKETNTRMYRSVNSISVKPNTQYQFSINGTTITEAPRYFFYDINKNKLSSTVTSGSFTTPDNCYYLTWHSSALKTDYPNGLSKTQIEEGSAATAYEPYYDYELCKVRDYKDEIKKSTGKNLFDKTISVWSSGSIGSTGSNINDTKSIRTNNISIKANTQYAFSFNTTTTINEFWVYYYKDTTFVTRISLGSGNLKEFITPNDVNYVRFRLTATNDINTNIISNEQLEYDTATEYEPHGKVWYIKKNIGKVVLDGSESWSLQQTSTNTLRFTAGNALTNGSTLNVMKIISDKFVNGTGTSDNTDNEHIRSATTGYADTISININKNRLTENTAAAFKTWLSNNPITVYYIVENPEYKVITNETLINQLNTIETFEGINNISIENENNVLPDLLMITKNKDSYNNWKTKEGLN